ncbi:serpin I2 [Erinaceus europaeus]|uniref:Serpin I2 n=1 Tax=Erinaceus europaeus TaxID=9365 RepID=A0A1S2ZS37_ERIEU|nr:serpin I2 [Erinaceus europaeus]
MDKILLWSLLLAISGSQASSPLAQDKTEFAVDLYQAVCSSHKKNVLFSPLGTKVLLGMIQLGARGKAQEQIRRALKTEEDSMGEEFSMLKLFFSAISEKKQQFTFNLANAIYLQEGFTVKEQYLHGNQHFFQSTIKLVDFQDAKACADTISTWVESRTDGKIKDMFSEQEFGPLTRLVLVNAIYFKGDWKQKFRKEDTELMNFTKRDGATVNIPMMKAFLRTRYGYFSEASMGYQILELPFKGDDFSLNIILPAEGINIEDIEKQITAHQIWKWFSEMREEEVDIRLPRFKIEHKLDFKGALHSLNITEIFSGGCDLSGITDSSELYVSKIIQKVFFEINEDGGEAAASTGMDIPMIMSLSRNQFIANRPFLFIMKNNPTESILFMGRLMNPDSEKMRGRDLDSL